MAKALFSDKELAQQKQRLDALRNAPGNYEQRSALRKAFQNEGVKRAQERHKEYLNALLVIVGSKCQQVPAFQDAFSKSSSKAMQKLLKEYNTPRTRRELYTILRALGEIPKSWGKSAVVRFFRGIGKQKGAKYHGAGLFGTAYGYTQREVDALCTVLCGDRWDGNHYSQVMMTYIDVEQEIYDAMQDGYEEIDYHTQFYATRVERDKKFLEKLCDELESQGLAPVPTPAAAKPKKVRKPKEFKDGDVIRKRHLRDLPLPAHVRIPVRKRDEGYDGAFNEGWYDDHIEQVVTYITDHGYYHCALVRPGTKKAYPESTYARKDDLDGATFLGLWTGQILKEKRLKTNFRYSPKNRAYH